jgi:hypothetical protein
MKTRATFTIIILCILFGATSCVVLVTKDSGHHKGWFKNSNNPHHPKTTNPGHTKGRSKN